MNPTIVCNNAVQDTVDLTYGEFGAVVLSTGGSIDSVLRCELGTSSAISVTNSGFSPMSAEDWAELWPYILLMMVTAVGIRWIVRTLSTDPGRSS